MQCSKKKCSDFRKGKFNYVSKNRLELITRTDSTQVEVNPVSKVEIHSSISWISDCEYVMTYENILNYPQDIKHMIGQKINIKIISINPNGYKVQAKSARMNNIIEFIIAK